MTVLVNGLKAAVLEVQEYTRLQIATIRGAVSRPFYFHDVVEQFDRIGLGSLTVVLLTGFFTGAVLALQSGMTLDQFGARPFVGRLISASMIKELGPVLTGLMLAGRVGSGIAAELGSMVVTDQVSALRALGTDPMRKLVVPRLLAATFMAPVLTVISDTVGITGGWVVATFQLRVASSLYWTSVTEGLYMQDIWMGVLKPFIIGFVIATIGCHVGLRTTGGTQGVGRSTTNAVVWASVMVIAVHYFVTRLLFTLLYWPDADFDRQSFHRLVVRGARDARRRVRLRVARVRRQGHPARHQLHAVPRPHEALARGERLRQVDDLEAAARPVETRRGRDSRERRARRHEDRSGDDGGPRGHRHGLPGRGAVRLADRRRERWLQALRGDAHPARR